MALQGRESLESIQFVQFHPEFAEALISFGVSVKFFLSYFPGR